VPFTAVIDEAKKVITVTPSSSFDYSQIYYLAIGAVEDESGNESTGSDIIFTTIDEPTPTVTVTYPVGGEVFYAGQDVTVTWDYENITNIKTESWVPDDDNNYSWITMAESTPAVDEEHDYTIPSDAYYGTQYKVRVSDVDNPDVYSESGSFTVLASASSLLELRTRYNSGNLDVDDVIKLNSEAIITYKLSSTNIYIQDTEAGLLIYDSGGKITTPYDLYDGITGLTGSIATDNNILEIIPVSDPGAATSSDNTVTPVTLTAASLNTDYDIYESMLIKINEVTFADAGSTFQSSQSYNVTDESGTTVFYTKFSSADYIGTTIPSGLRNVTGICMQQNTTAEISSRNLLDFEVATGIEKASPVDLITIYPVPATSVLNISNVPNLRSIEILDVSGRVIETIKFSSDEVIQIPVYKLKRGLYLIRFKTTNGNLIRKFVKS